MLCFKWFRLFLEISQINLLIYLKRHVAPTEQPLTDNRAVRFHLSTIFTWDRAMHRNVSKYVTMTLSSAVLVSTIFHFSKVAEISRKQLSEHEFRNTTESISRRYKRSHNDFRSHRTSQMKKLKKHGFFCRNMLTFSSDSFSVILRASSIINGFLARL